MKLGEPFRVYLRCPTVNDWHGGPGWKYARIKADWLRAFPPAVPKAKVKRAVHIVRVYPSGVGQRRYDEDNLKAGCKPILDSLKTLGWLVNDSPVWCSLTVEQRHPLNGEWVPSTLVTVIDEDARLTR